MLLKKNLLLKIIITMKLNEVNTKKNNKFLYV